MVAQRLMYNGLGNARPAMVEDSVGRLQACFQMDVKGGINRLRFGLQKLPIKNTLILLGTKVYNTAQRLKIRQCRTGTWSLERKILRHPFWMSEMAQYPKRPDCHSVFLFRYAFDVAIED